jgi:aspartyl-tRNA(Asn)/glutamyl-tRNA(Gln) amidotransferase subunit A
MTVLPDTRTIAEIAPLVAARTLSPVDLVRACLTRIDPRRDLNAFITVMAEDALDAARRAEQEIAAGGYRGALHGIPISLKDLIDVAGTPTTSASAVPPLMPRVDAPVAERLRAAGAIVIGKTNLHEFAFGTTSDETAFGVVRHPLDPSRSPGGSSGGAAVALLEGMCFGSVGTDTGGSIRIPAAACGIVGLKPTAGELPTEGIVPLSTTCDHVGPMTRTVRDAGIMYAAMNGDASASWSRRATPAATLGVLGGYFTEKLDVDVRAVFSAVGSRLQAAGHRMRDTAVDGAASTADVYLHIVLPEAARYHAPFIEQYADKYSPGVRLRIEMGRYVLAEDYVRAMDLRAALRAAVDRALDGCDALMLPAMAIPAPPLGAGSVDVGDHKLPVRAVMLRLTQLFNITGHPAISIPAGHARDGFPIGLQLVGRRGETAALLDVALAVEAQIGVGPGSVGGGVG